MAVSFKVRRGTTTEHSSFVGEEGEITVAIPVDNSGNSITGDTNNPWVLRVHDGVKSGGHTMQASSGDIPATSTVNVTSVSSGGTVEIQQDYRTRSMKMSLALGGDF